MDTILNRDTWPKKSAGHEINRLKVCAPCGKKLSVKDQVISEVDEINIKKLINPLYDSANPQYPRGICNTCRSYLTKAVNSGGNSRLPKMLNYEDIVLLRVIRLPKTSCCCYICLTGSSKAKNKRTNSDTISRDSGIHASIHLSKLPDKVPEKKKKPS